MEDAGVRWGQVVNRARSYHTLGTVELLHHYPRGGRAKKAHGDELRGPKKNKLRRSQRHSYSRCWFIGGHHQFG